MLRAEDISRTQRYKKPHTSIIPFLRSEAEKNNAHSEEQVKDPAPPLKNTTIDAEPKRSSYQEEILKITRNLED